MRETREKMMIHDESDDTVGFWNEEPGLRTFSLIMMITPGVFAEWDLRLQMRVMVLPAGKPEYAICTNRSFIRQMTRGH